MTLLGNEKKKGVEGNATELFILKNIDSGRTGIDFCFMIFR